MKYDSNTYFLNMINPSSLTPSQIKQLEAINGFEIIPGTIQANFGIIHIGFINHNIVGTIKISEQDSYIKGLSKDNPIDHETYIFFIDTSSKGNHDLLNAKVLVNASCNSKGLHFIEISMKNSKIELKYDYYDGKTINAMQKLKLKLKEININNINSITTDDLLDYGFLPDIHNELSLNPSVLGDLLDYTIIDINKLLTRLDFCWITNTLDKLMDGDKKYYHPQNADEKTFCLQKVLKGKD